jgi:D-alanyl-D-alanine carboxypeptidase
MAKLADSLIKDFPKYYAYFSRDHYKFRGKAYKNHNNLLRSYEGTDGIKTGYIRASGFNLAASVARDNYRLIGVVFGGKTAKSRDKHMTTLLEREFKKLALRDKQRPATNTFAALSKKKLTRKNDASPVRAAPRPPAAPRPVAAPRATQPFVTVAPAAPKAAVTASAKPVTLAAASTEWSQDTTEWAIQVGAYGDIAPARAAAKQAVSRIPELTARTHISIAPYRTGDHIMYRARLIGMSGESAKQACVRLERRRIPCIAIAPDRVKQPQASDTNQTATRQP